MEETLMQSENNIKLTSAEISQLWSAYMNDSLSICVLKYFSECIDDSKNLLKKTGNVLLSKGLYIRAPYVTTPEKVDFIRKQNFLAGWFGERRSLTTLEI